MTEAISSTRGVGQGEAQNLSAGGLLLRLEHPLRPGDPIQVTLRLSRCPPLVLTGTVAWAQPHSEFSGWALGIMFGEELPGEIVGEIADADRTLEALRRPGVEAFHLGHAVADPDRKVHLVPRGLVGEGSRFRRAG